MWAFRRFDIGALQKNTADAFSSGPETDGTSADLLIISFSARLGRGRYRCTITTRRVVTNRHRRRRSARSVSRVRLLNATPSLLRHAACRGTLAVSRHTFLRVPRALHLDDVFTLGRRLVKRALLSRKLTYTKLRQISITYLVRVCDGGHGTHYVIDTPCFYTYIHT